MKTCKTCQQTKPLEDFYKHGKAADGRQIHCKSCSSAIAKARRQSRDNTTDDRRKRLWTHYRLTVKQFEAMAANGCMVCGSYEDLVVDHDHNCCPTTGTQKRTCGRCVRGVLCGPCNKAEGFLDSNPDRAIALAAYLIQTKEASAEANIR